MGSRDLWGTWHSMKSGMNRTRRQTSRGSSRLSWSGCGRSWGQGSPCKQGLCPRGTPIDSCLTSPEQPLHELVRTQLLGLWRARGWAKATQRARTGLCLCPSPACGLSITEREEALDSIFGFQIWFLRTSLGVPQTPLGRMGLLNGIGSWGSKPHPAWIRAAPLGSTWIYCLLERFHLMTQHLGSKLCKH